MAGTERTCSIEGCDNPPRKKSMCATHEYRKWKFGDPHHGGKIRRYAKSPEEAFSEYVSPDGECLIWTGPKNSFGYGIINVDGKKTVAHRYSWERKNGAIPEGADLDHSCWNKACVRTEHLRIATRSENLANQAGPKSTNRASGVRNVYRKRDRWRVMISKDGKSHSFGTYPTIEAAAKVAEAKRRELFGDFSGRG